MLGLLLLVAPVFLRFLGVMGCGDMRWTNRRMPRHVGVWGVRWFERQGVREVLYAGSGEISEAYVSVFGSMAGPIFRPKRLLESFGRCR